MVTETQKKGLNASDAASLRQQAVHLLERLIADREQSERRFAESGKRDPMKFITGRTSLENAITSTREMIANMDALLAKMENELEQAESGSRTASRPTSRAAARLGLRSPKAVVLTGTP